jgi:DNA-binding transcriptional MerR regulator
VPVRISELAEKVRVPTSTVRYYERIGLLGTPARTPAGYRDYDENAVGRLLFVHRARTIGLSCDQTAELLTVWRGVDCSGARSRVADLIDEKQADIAERIAELAAFSAQLRDVRMMLDASPAPPTCRADLLCCLPSAQITVVPLDSVGHPRHRG